MSEEKKVEDSSKAPEKNKHHDRYKVRYSHILKYLKFSLNFYLGPYMGQ